MSDEVADLQKQLKASEANISSTILEKESIAEKLLLSRKDLSTQKAEYEKLKKSYESKQQNIDSIVL